MKHSKIIGIAVVALGLIGVGIVNADGLNPRNPVEFYSGHTHDQEGTSGAPSHSGGTDRYGCHNGSVPYHCH